MKINPTLTPVKYSSSSRAKEHMNAKKRSESHFQRAIDYFLADDFTNAYLWSVRATRLHHPEAEWLVGHLLLRGDGCKKDISNAVQYLTKASKKGVAYAHYELASCFYLGEGVQRNVSTFIKLIKLAAKKGVPAAAESLALAYRDGEGVKRNYKLAVKWFLVAAEKGLPESMYCLYVRYKMGQGVYQNMSEAMRWLIKAANAGHAISQRILGESYYYGDHGLPEDKRLAFEYCFKSAQQNDAEAAYCVALCYIDGDGGVCKSLYAAKYWLKRAANQDYAAAQLALARMLLREKSKTAFQQATVWLKRGADLGNSDCKYGLELLQQMQDQGISWFAV